MPLSFTSKTEDEDTNLDVILTLSANNDPEEIHAALRHSYLWCHYIETFLTRSELFKH
jgi:hypothetical protein